MSKLNLTVSSMVLRFDAGGYRLEHFIPYVLTLPGCRRTEEIRDFGVVVIEFGELTQPPGLILKLVELAWYNRKIGKDRWADILAAHLRPEK